MNRRWVPYALTAPGLLFLLLAFALPLVLSVGTSLSGVEGGLFAYYRKVLSDPYYLAALGRTLRYSVAVTLLQEIQETAARWSDAPVNKLA